MLLESFSFTDHARRRARQRAAQADAIELVLRYADICVAVGEGCECLSMSARALSAISVAEAPPALRERAKALAVVIDASQETVVTVLRLSGRRARRYRHRFATWRTGEQQARAMVPIDNHLRSQDRKACGWQVISTAPGTQPAARLCQQTAH